MKAIPHELVPPTKKSGKLDTSTNTTPTASLYTELPYPADGVVRTTIANILYQGLLKHSPGLLRKEKLLIADVGCGTGEMTVGTALKFSNARVIAFDINPPSLEQAEALARSSSVNIRFVQADIASGLGSAAERAGLAPTEKFDIVTSIGVLHHMSDPAKGFAEIRKLISPAGFFFCFVYSRMGRWSDIAVKQLLNRSTSVGSFQLRAEMVSRLQLSDKHRMWNFVRNFGDRLKHGPPINLFEHAKVFFKRNPLTHVSDTFSNPCEHMYTFAELQEICCETDWSFVALAEKGGIPVSPEAFTKNSSTLRLLKSLPPDVVYDYFAFKYRADGFYFFLRPAGVPGP